MSQTGSGTIVPTEGEHQYIENRAAILAALPAAGWIFDGWDGDDVEDDDNPYTMVVMNDDKNIEAVFKEAVTLTIIATGGGSTTPPSGVITAYVKGTNATIKAAPITDYEFSSWSGDLVSTKDTETITMDADKVIGCTFRPVSAVASTVRKLYLGTDAKKAYWNVDNQWVFFATIRHSQMEELDQDSHQQYHNDKRGDERYYTKTELESTDDNESGADLVGATTIPGLSGVTVQELLEALKALVDTKGSGDGVEVPFTSASIWTIEHNLGRLALITVWEETAAANGFGTQAFGTSPFGGTDAVYTVADPEAAVVTQQGLTTAIVTWATTKTGKVVYI